MLSLLKREGSTAPLFVWAHSWPPHSPFLPPASTRYRLLPPGELDKWRDMMADNIAYPASQQARVDMHRLRYRESIMAADAALGEFLAELERQGRLDKALIVITSDHGESFEKGLLGHTGPLMHDSLVRVPLVVKLPGQKLGQVVGMPVSQADLAPTLLDLAAAPAMPDSEGRSLRDALEGRPLPSAPVFAMTLERQSRFKPLGQGQFMVIEGDQKLTLTLDKATGVQPTPTLFNLQTDPTETNDLAGQQPERVRELTTVLRRRIEMAEQARTQAAVRAP